MKRIYFLFSAFSFISASLASGLSLDTLPAMAKTAGCGSGSSVYLLKILSPVGSNQFRVACNEHDTCYDTFGKSQQECDKAFHNRMLGICKRDHNTIVGRPLRIACNGRADAYYSAVRNHGGDAYKQAQANASGGISGGSALRNQWSDKCLQTMGQENVNGSSANIWDCTNTSNQFWERTSNGEFRNQWSGKCLQTMGQDKENGSAINIWDCTNTSNQFWR